MKLSNLALRAEAGEPDPPLPAPDAPAPEELWPSAGRLAHSHRPGLDYRAIVIRDQGLRLFWMR